MYQREGEDEEVELGLELELDEALPGDSYSFGSSDDDKGERRCKGARTRYSIGEGWCCEREGQKRLRPQEKLRAINTHPRGLHSKCSLASRNGSRVGNRKSNDSEECLSDLRQEVSTCSSWQEHIFRDCIHTVMREFIIEMT